MTNAAANIPLLHQSWKTVGFIINLARYKIALQGEAEERRHFHTTKFLNVNNAVMRSNFSVDSMSNFNITVTHLVYLPELQQQLEDHRSHDWVVIWGLVKRWQIFGVNLFIFWFERWFRVNISNKKKTNNNLKLLKVLNMHIVQVYCT